MVRKNAKTRRGAAVRCFAAIGFLLALASGCPTSSDEGPLFLDDFESIADGWPDWTPEGEGGWNNLSIGEAGGDGHVRIMLDDNPGGMAHFVQHDSGGWSLLVNDNFAGANYIFSMKIICGATVGGLGIIGRYNDLSNYYYLEMSGGTTLSIYKMHGDVYDQVATVPAAYSVDTIYTIKLVLIGGSVTGYLDDVSVSYADDGMTYGPVITSGKIGFGGDTGTLGGYDYALAIGN